MRFTANRSSLLVAGFVAVLAFVAGIVVGMWWLAEESPETASVVVYDSDGPTAVETPSRAIRTIEELVGFRPAVPASLPLDGVKLVGVRSVLPPLVDPGAERSHLIYVSGEPGPEELIMVSQSSVYWGVELAGQHAIDIGQSDVETWRIGEPDTRGPQYWLKVGDQFVYLLFGAREPLSDDDVRPMLRSIAEQLAN